ncbi:hypothetical protein [uncultured Tolumonas sp.]|uniref:WapI family immunity protein n=1 Tax=uncultured Tolumonas sp. TaxID=263765 RepID=UPI002931E7F5|nr:hypothetical protein [uncultured Tolumonas sp.]
MHIGSEHEYINIIEIDRNAAGSPCAGNIKAEITLKLHSFQGSYDEVWLEHSEIMRFLSEVKNLESSHRGSAKIASVSPDELLFEVRSFDNLGHMEIEVQLHCYQFDGTKYRPTFLKGEFEINPSNLHKIISIFEAFTI